MPSKFMQIPNASCLSPVHTRSQQPSKSTDLVHSTLKLFGVIQAGSAALGSVANKPNHFATWHMFQHRRTRHCPYPMWLCQLLSHVLQYLWFGCWGSQNEGWLGRHATIPCLSLRAGVFSCWSSVYCVWTTHTCELSWVHTHTRWSLNLYSILRIMRMMLERCWREKVHSIPFSRPKGKKVSTGDMSDTYSNITICWQSSWVWSLHLVDWQWDEDVCGDGFKQGSLLDPFHLAKRCEYVWDRLRMYSIVVYKLEALPPNERFLSETKKAFAQSGRRADCSQQRQHFIHTFNSSLSDKYRSVHGPLGPCSTSRAAPVPLPYLSLRV